LSWETHRVQREMNKRQGQIAQEVTLIASIDDRLSEIEIKYATAHRLSDLGREAAARELGERARVVVTSLLGDVENLSTLEAAKVSAASSQFRDLAGAMNSTAESLSRVVSIASMTAEDVATSAHDLSEVSQQISVSASQ